MPYPVLPPSPPPVVNYLLPKEFSQSAPAATHESVAQSAQSTVSSSAIEPSSALSSKLCSSVAGVNTCHKSATPAPANQSAAGEPGRNAVLRAGALGSPVEVNLSTPQPAPSQPSSGSAQSYWQFQGSEAASSLVWAETNAPLPELDGLSQAIGSTFATKPEQLLAQSSSRSNNQLDNQLNSQPQSGSPLSIPELKPDQATPNSEPANQQLLIPASQAGVGADREQVQQDSSQQNSGQQGSEPQNSDGQQGGEQAPVNPASPAGQTLVIPGQSTGGGTPPEQTPPSGTGSQPTQPTPPPQATPATPPSNPRRNGRGNNQSPFGEVIMPGDVVELTADRQDYDERQRIFTAEGHAVMRYRQSTLAADRIQVNLPNRIAVAEGNVGLTRGQQVLQGDRFVYNFVQNEGTVTGARGQLFVPAAANDFTPTLPTDISASAVANQVLTDRLSAAQPLQVSGSTGGITVGVSAGLPGSSAGGQGPLGTGITGNVNRLRFEADRIDFAGDVSVGSNVRITNDPFSPPELELRSNRVTFTRETTTRSVIRANNPRVVFDQRFSLPLLQNQIVLDRRSRNSPFFSFGYDERDRGGFYVEKPFDVITSPAVSLTLTPQYLVQRAYDARDFLAASDFGLVAQLNVTVSPTTSLVGTASLATLDFGDLEDNVRASIRARQQLFNHTLALEYSYRNRLFNGSLGYQTVQSSLGFVITSPTYTLFTPTPRSPGLAVSYQAGIQRINAETDFSNLLPPAPRDNDRIFLTRYQASAALNYPYYLWFGTTLPATATQGLRYTPNPVLPYVAVNLGLRGVYSAYSSGDTQADLTGTVSLSAQFGHFSRPFLDYTALIAVYSATALSGKSPFRFDRVADQHVVTLGITQQIYGPFRFGVVTSINLDKSKEIDTTYTLEYSRRTYAVTLSFSPVREAAALTLRISDFNWVGNPTRFSGLGSPVVSGGVERTSY